MKSAAAPWSLSLACRAGGKVSGGDVAEGGMVRAGRDIDSFIERVKRMI